MCLPSVVTETGISLPSCSSLPLLGVVFSNDLRWNDHVHSIVKKASRRIFLIRNLKRAGCSASVMFSAYVAFIRSVLLYCFPVFCNVSSSLFNSIKRVERRVFRLIGKEAHDFLTIDVAAENVCKRLFNHVSQDVQHPLRSLFENRAPTPRNRSVLKPPFARTVRYKKSFIRFGA